MCFNEETFINKHKTIYKYYFSKVRVIYLIHTSPAVLIVIAGTRIDDDAPFPIATLIGVMYCLYVVYFWSAFFNNRRKYFTHIKRYADKYQRMDMSYSLSVSDTNIIYKDEEKSYTFIWGLFKPIVEYQGLLLLVSKETDQTLMSISKDEVGEAEYRQLFTTLKEKVGNL